MNYFTYLSEILRIYFPLPTLNFLSLIICISFCQTNQTPNSDPLMSNLDTNWSFIPASVLLNPPANQSPLLAPQYPDVSEFDLIRSKEEKTQLIRPDRQHKAKYSQGQSCH